MTLIRIRPALAAVVIGGVGLGSLLALEHVSPPAPPSSIVDVVKVKQADPASNGNHVRHCTDGKGSDAEKNKHCREVSGAQ